MSKPTRRTMIMGGCAVLFLVSAIGYRFYDSTHTASLARQSQNKSDDSAHSSNKNPLLNAPKNATNGIPVRGNIDQSVALLAQQIVENSPNQQEAFAFLVEAKSYRIQEMKTRRAKEKAAEAKAIYDAELWEKKKGKIGADLEKANEPTSIDTQAGNSSQNTVETVYRRNSRSDADTDSRKHKKLELSDFRIRAIIREGNEYVARLQYGKTSMPAKKGYTLLGKVKVSDIKSDSVTLSMGDQTLPLYAY